MNYGVTTIPVELYVGKIKRHFATTIWEHLSTDKNSHFLHHFKSSETAELYVLNIVFSILDTDSTNLPAQNQAGAAYSLGKNFT